MKHIKKFLIFPLLLLIPGPARACLFFCGGEGWDVESLDEFNLPGPDDGVIGILTNLLLWLFFVVGIIAVIAFVVTGIIYITSAGDEDQAKRAKRALTNSVIGIVVALIGWAVIKLVYSLLVGETGDI